MSFMRGFVREAFSLITWLTAFLLQASFMSNLSVHLTAFADPVVRDICAVIGLFVATLMLGGLINYIIGQMVNKTGLSGTDRLLGLFTFTCVPIVCAFLFVAEYFS